MNKNAFTIVEIVIVMFLLILVASVFIPLNMANVAQAERVARWKTTFDEVKYSFDLLKVQQPELFASLSNLKKTDSEAAFNIIKPYLDLEEEPNQEISFVNYKYKFRNNRKVKENSHFYVKDFAVLKTGVIIGFKLNKTRSFSTRSPFAIMIFDINGFEKPNKLGLDIFGVNVYKDSIKPFGEGRSNSVLKANCSPMGSGAMCSKYYLIGGNF